MIKRINEHTGLNLSYTGQNTKPYFWVDIIEHVLKDEQGKTYVLAIAIHPFDRHYLKAVATNFSKANDNPIVYYQEIEYTTVIVIDEMRIRSFRCGRDSSSLSIEEGVGSLFPSKVLPNIQSLNSYKKLICSIDNDEAFSLRPLCYVNGLNVKKKHFNCFLKELLKFRENFYENIDIRMDPLNNNGNIPFSLNHFLSVYPNNENYLLKVSDDLYAVNVPLSINNKLAIFGTWNVAITRTMFLKAASHIFKSFHSVGNIEYTNILFDPYIDDKRWRHNDFYIPLPKTIEEIKMRISSKSRHNLKRERRLIDEAFSNLRLEEIKISSSFPQYVVDKFYEFKNSTHRDIKDDYDITARNITNVYLLKTGINDIRGIALSCEQGPIVFMENHTFDSSRREYSFGQVLYDMYLEELIKKGKVGLSLAGGNLEYKKRYGSICYIAYSGTVKREMISRIDVLKKHGWDKHNFFVKLTYLLTRKSK